MRNLTTTRHAARSAFTLVELLLVISIIAILASLGVGLIAQAQEDAAVGATRSRITLIQKILEIELEDYEVRRSPVSVRALIDIANASSLDTTSNQTLLHAKNLKRMIIADLIRAEMPDGFELSAMGLDPDDSSSVNQLGQFPSPTLLAYMNEVGIAPSAITTINTGWVAWANSRTPAPWKVPEDTTLDEFDDGAASRAELLYQILQNINVDGVPAIETLGSQAIGDSDGNGIPEVVDAWGDPLFLQWQQEELGPPDPAPLVPPATEVMPNYATGDLDDGIWASSGLFVGLSKEHTTHTTLDPLQYSKPVLPTQIRPFLTSERMIKIDGIPADYNTDHTF